MGLSLMSNYQTFLFLVLASGKFLRAHRGRKGPFNTFSKNIFSKLVSIDKNQPNNSNFIYGSLYRVVKGSKRAKNVEKSHKFGLKRIFQKKLFWLIWNKSIPIMKKNWCQYITLGLIFSHLVNLTYHFRIYYQQLSTTL